MVSTWKRKLAGLMMSGFLALAGCGGSSDSSPNTGTLSIGLTDGPIDDAERVMIQFTGLELKPASGPPESYPFDPDACDVYDAIAETCTIDLLALQGIEQRTIFAKDLPVGEYNWIRLMVNAELNVTDSYVEFLGPTWCPLYIPSGSETGLKLQGPLQVAANGSRYILDLDLYESIIQPPGLAGDPDPSMCVENFLLRPVVRIVDNTEAGSIAGIVDRSVLYDEVASTPLFAGCVENESGFVDDLKVYAFEDFAGQPVPAALDDYDAVADPARPVASALVEYDWTSGVYSYELGYLLAGNYLLGLSCNASLDDPDVENFVSGVDAVGTCEDSGEASFCFIADRAVDVAPELINEGDFPVPLP